MLHLTYHELELQSVPDLYRVSCTLFEKHLVVLRALDTTYSQYHVTFDDGHISNYDLGLPLLEKYGMRSIFFITTEWIGVQDRMSGQQLRELLVQGHQIGSHSCSHVFLPLCSDSKLLNELYYSRKELEDVLGSAVTDVSLPYGRWDRRVLRACLKAGYSQVYTSDPWLSPIMREGIAVAGRLTLRNSVDAVQLRRLLMAKGITRARLQVPYRMKQALKLCIGDRMYHRVWHAFANRNEYAMPTPNETQE
jgi:hypothetical protein